MVNHYGNSSKDYYAKPLPIDSTDWEDDVIPLTQTDTTGWFSFTNDANTSYSIYEQVGASPTSLDLASAGVPSQVNGESMAPTAEEIAQEIERSGGMLHTLSAIFDGIDKLIKWIRR